MSVIPGIKFVGMDVDGTLIHNKQLMIAARKRYVLKILSLMNGANYEQAESYYKAQTALHKTHLQIFQELGLQIDEVQMTQMMDEQIIQDRLNLIPPDQELSHLFNDLKKANMILTVCRNGDLASTRATLCRLLDQPYHAQNLHVGIESFQVVLPELRTGVGQIDFMIPTVELGVLKPDRKPFELMARIAEEFGATPSECVMIGDSFDNDIKIPKEMGMRTVLIGRKEGQINPGADFMVPSIYHVRQLLL